VLEVGGVYLAATSASFQARWSEVNQQLVVAVAEHLRLVEPST
jgi:hypothetical protein